MNEWKVIFATALIFGAGVVTGGLLVDHVTHPHAKPHPAASGSNSSTNSVSKSAAPKAKLPEILSRQFVDTLETNLNLTLGQRADIEKIIADSQDEMRRKFQDARQSAREQIRKELAPWQAKRFDDLLKQQREVRAVKKAAATTNSTNTAFEPAKSVSVVETNSP